MSLTGLAFVLVYFFGLVKALIDKPVYGLYSYIFAFYLHPPSQWWGKTLPDLRWSLLAATVTFIAILINKNKDKYAWFKFTETKLFAAFTVYVAVQSFWVLNFDIHKEYIFLSIKFLMLILIIQCCIIRSRDLVGFIVLNLVGCAFLSYQGLGGGRLENLGTPGLENSNQLAQHLAVILVSSSFLILCTRKKIKWLLLPLFILVLNGIMLTQSRSVVIGLVVCGFFVALFPPPSIRKQLYIYMGLAIIASLILMGPRLASKFATITSNDAGISQQDKSAESRIEIIKGQWAMFVERPLLGWGHRGTLLLSNSYISGEYLTKTNGEGGGVRASHNFIMSLLVDHGLVGAALYLLVIWMCIKKGVSARYRGDSDTKTSLEAILSIGFVSALVCLMVTGLGSNNKKLEIDVWLYAIIPLIYHTINKNDEKSKNFAV